MTGTPRRLEDFADRIQPNAASNLLLWGIVGFLVIFVIWASLTEIDRTVRGRGRVIPNAQLQSVSNLEGGVVEAILVRTGQWVKAGTPLIRLDQTQSGGEFGSGQASTDALAAKIARLEAELAGRSPVYPAARDDTVAAQIEIEKTLHASRSADLESLLASTRAQVVQANQAVSEAEATRDSRLSARRAAGMELDLVRPLVERGIEPRLALVQAESRHRIAISDAASVEASVARARARVAEARANLVQARQDWRVQTATELAAARAELAARRKTLPALADRVSRTVVTAPLDGIVNRVAVTTVGGTVGAGASLVEIVPSHGGLLVEALISAKDIALVRIGQKAKVSLTAYDQAVYGSLPGKVATISPDATVDEKSGESFYTIKINTEAALRSPRGQRLPIGTGMVADVSVLGDKRSVMSYMLTPITRLSETAFRE